MAVNAAIRPGLTIFRLLVALGKRSWSSPLDQLKTYSQIVKLPTTKTTPAQTTKTQRLQELESGCGHSRKAVPDNMNNNAVLGLIGTQLGTIALKTLIL